MNRNNQLNFYFVLISSFFFGSSALAYPIFAQKAYENPREETGRIVCANCHLASKPIGVELPQSILPSQVFSVRVEIPVSETAQQVLRSGDKGSLNVRAVVVMPDDFRLAKPKELSKEQKQASKGIVFQTYNEAHNNIFVAGPIGKKRELILNLVAPESIPYRSYPVYVGRNRGRGQIYPDGQKSNNTAFTSPMKRIVEEIVSDSRRNLVIVANSERRKAEIEVPKGPSIIVSKGQSIDVDQPLTNNPNVGRFRQLQSEIVFQSPLRLLSLQAFLWSSFLAQIFLVMKKKQIEIVQAQSSG